MPSWNVLIGKDLFIVGFNERVEPVIVEKGFLVKDKIQVVQDDHKRVLTSIVGNEDLTVILPAALEDLYKKLEEENKKVFSPPVWAHQVNNYGIIGHYSADETASQLFPLMAQKYLLAELDRPFDDIHKQIDDLAERLSR